MSSVADHPLDNPVIQYLLEGHLPNYINDFVKNPFAKPSEEPEKYSKFLKEALECLDFRVVFYLMSELYPDVDPFVIFSPVDCAVNGILPAAAWIFTEYDDWGGVMVYYAYDNGHYELCELIISMTDATIWYDLDHLLKRIDLDNNVRMMAAFPYDRNFMLKVAYCGLLNILKYAHYTGKFLDFEVICKFSAEFGHFEFLKYAVSINCPLDLQVCGYAAVSSGSFECFEFMHKQGYVMDEETCAKAAENGSLEILKYARENGCNWDVRTCTFAAKKGHIKCLKYAHENGCTWDATTCAKAAIIGSLECLKYAHENGCTWDATTCEMAALMGDLEILKYAHENGCPWDSQVFVTLNRKLDLLTQGSRDYQTYFECKSYAMMNGCPQIDA